jgi:periplasmic divalent cation tolerance protein
MSSDFVQLQTTVDSREAGDDLALRIVEAELAACVQVLGPIGSTYRWDGEIESATAEWLLLMKTTRQLAEPLSEFVRDRHPYDVPELIALPIIDGSSDYLDWVQAQVRSE